MASTNRTEVASAEVQSIASRIAMMQTRQTKAKSRLAVIETEASDLRLELNALNTEHLELLRKFDAAAKLP